MKLKKINILISMTIIIALLPIITYAALHPQIMLSVETIEVGTVVQGEIKTLLVTVQNGGDEILEIKSVTTDCPCAKFAFSGLNSQGKGSAKLEEVPIEIGPKRERTMQVTFNSSKTGHVGKFTKIIMIGSNDPKFPLKKLKMIGEIIKPGDE